MWKKKVEGGKRKSGREKVRLGPPEGAVAEADLDNPYSEANMKKLKEENALQFVVKPLKVRRGDFLVEGGLQDATEVVSTSDEAKVVEEAEEVAEEEAEWVQRRIAKAKEARRRQSHFATLDDELLEHRPAQNATRGHGLPLMEVDETIEEGGDEGSEDDALQERQAIGAAYDGRYYFEDAVEKKEETFKVDEREWEGERDEDDLAWEMELIRRSGVKRSHQTIGGAPHREVKREDEGKKGMVRRETMAIPERLVEPWSEQEVLRRIEMELSQLQSITALHENRLEVIERAKEEDEEFLKTVDTALSQASSDLTFFEDLKVYIINLIDCLESKLTTIEGLEGEMFGARTRLTKKTQSLTSNALLSAYSLAESKKPISTPQSSPFHTWRASFNPQNNLSNPSNDQFDFFSPQLELEAGYESDLETNEHDRCSYEQELIRIAEEARKVFNDVKEDFSDLHLILQHFSLLRSRYPLSYKQSHMSEQLKDLLGPLIRLEMLPWDPCLSYSPLFDWPWFQEVDQYCLAGEDSSMASDGQPTQEKTVLPSATVDAALIPNLVSSIHLAKVKESIKYFWRVNSVKVTQNLQNLLNQFRMVHISPPLLSDLLKTIHGALTHALVSISLPNMLVSGNEDYGKVIFFRILKLIHIFTLWSPFFSFDAIASLIWNKAIDSKIMPYLREIMKANDFSLAWLLTRSLLAAIAPHFQKHSQLITSQQLEASLRAFIENLEITSLGHFPSFHLNQQTSSFWKLLLSS